MNSAEMEIIVKAAVNQATQGLQQVQQNLAKTSVAASKLDNSLQLIDENIKTIDQ